MGKTANVRARRKPVAQRQKQNTKLPAGDGSILMSHNFPDAIAPQDYFGITQVHGDSYGWEGPSLAPSTRSEYRHLTPSNARFNAARHLTVDAEAKLATRQRAEAQSVAEEVTGTLLEKAFREGNRRQRAEAQSVAQEVTGTLLEKAFREGNRRQRAEAQSVAQEVTGTLLEKAFREGNRRQRAEAQSVAEEVTGTLLEKAFREGNRRQTSRGSVSGPGGDRNVV